MAKLEDIDFSKLDLQDPEVIKLLKMLDKDQTYNSKLKWFYDNAYPWQREAIKLTAHHKVTGLVCGNQMGKSETACAIVAAHLTGEYPIWWQGKRFDHPVNVWVAGPDGRHNREVLQKRLFGTDNKRLKKEMGTGMIPKRNIIDNSMVTIRGNDIDSAKIKHKSGGTSELSFRAYTQGREAAQGAPVHVIVVDEQPNGEWWKEALTRTRATKGHALLSFTPLKDASTSGNLLDNLMALPPAEDSPEDDFGPKYLSDGTWGLIRASWYDAPHILENDPNAIEEAKREYSFDYEARVFGIPIVGSGRVYPHSRDKITFDPESTFINKEWEALIGIDWGWTTNDPSAMIKITRDKTNDILYVTDEFKGHTPTDQDFARQVHFIDPYLPVAWPRDGNTSSDWKGGGTISDKLRSEYRVNLLRDPFLNPIGLDGGKNNHLDPGFQEINDRLRTNRLKISVKCEELLNEMENYGYGVDNNGISTGKPKKYSEDHLCDAFRYAVMTIIQGFGMQPYNRKKLGQRRDTEADERWKRSII